MFITSFVFLALATSALAGPLFNSITVELSGPKASVGSADDLKFTASVKNAGSSDVKILKYGTVLDGNSPTRSFTVTKDGVAVPFTGVKLSVSLDDLDDSAFTTIPAGETVTVNHDVAALFDFASAGPGKFSFEPVATFQVVGTEGSARFIRVEATTTAVEVEITGVIAKRELPQINKRAVDICTTPSRKSFIDASYSEAKSLASVASSYINSHASDTLYKAYFGASSPSRVIAVFNAVASENSSTRTLSCVDELGICSGGVIAYTVFSTTNIYFCSIFFTQAPTTSLCSGNPIDYPNARGVTTLRELIHAVNAGIVSITSGCAAAQALSDADSVINTDNYLCFAAQVYINTRC